MDTDPLFITLTMIRYRRKVLAKQIENLSQEENELATAEQVLLRLQDKSDEKPEISPDVPNHPVVAGWSGT